MAKRQTIRKDTRSSAAAGKRSQEIKTWGTIQKMDATLRTGKIALHGKRGVDIVSDPNNNIVRRKSAKRTVVRRKSSMGPQP